MSEYEMDMSKMKTGLFGQEGLDFCTFLDFNLARGWNLCDREDMEDFYTAAWWSLGGHHLDNTLKLACPEEYLK